MRKTRALVAAAGASLIAATLVAGPVGNASAGGPRHHHDNRPARVLIVLFDQMLPAYADQFNMPNFRRVRDSGTNFKDAYLGYMASETVLAHNVIPSGLLPKNMGYTDEAYRDHANVFGKGAGAMHITGDLSLDDFVTIQKNHGRTYPKLADYLHKARPGTKFITVGEKSYAVDTATGASGDIGVHLSGRKLELQCPQRDDRSGLPQPLARRPDLDRQARLARTGRQEGAFLPHQACPGQPEVVRALLRQLGQGQRLRHRSARSRRGCTPLTATATGQATTPAHLGGDTWVADAATTMMKREHWSGMFLTLGAIDKAAHMWGAMADTATEDLQDPRQPDPRQVRRRERRPAARQAARPGQAGRQAARWQDPGRAHGRPRRDVRQELLRQANLGRR